MSKLYIGNILISSIVSTSPPTSEGGTTVSFQTLDGKKYIQQIGVPAEYMDVECIISESSKVTLDKAFSEVGAVRVNRYGINYLGYMEEPPSYERVQNSMSDTKRLYRAGLRLYLGDEE